MKKKRQNLDESHAKKWLRVTGIQRYLPTDAMDPPDFVVEDRYAVEVRRLDRPDDKHAESPWKGPCQDFALRNLVHPPKDSQSGSVVVIAIRVSLPDTKEVNEQVWKAVRWVEIGPPGDWLEVLSCELECGIRLYFHPPIESPPCCDKFELHGARVGLPQWGSPNELVDMIQPLS